MVLTTCLGADRLRDMPRQPLGDNAQRVKRLVLADPDIRPRDIAIMLGLSVQRVYQLIDALRERGELDEPDEVPA
jgi:hypothetical protein